MSNSPTQHQSQVFARQTSDILLDTKSVLIRPERPFTLTSGRISPVYVDCRRLIGFPQERAKLIQMAVAHLKSFHAQFDAVAGGETAGIAWAAWIAEKLDLPMAYIRKKPKG
ncbi:MAG: orotate phosphoribosyltransferase, partial [Pseudomonadota bacterium]